MRNFFNSPAFQSLLWKAKNVPHRVRGTKQELQRLANVGVLSELQGTLIKADGTQIPLGVMSRRVVTTAGANFIRDAFGNTTELENLKYHASGTGSVAENITDTALGTEVEAARTSGSQNVATSKTYITAGTISYTATRAITEHGLFSASTTGTLFDRSVFTAVNVVSGDSIAFTYTLTIADNG